jgi:hypothetical protein
MTLLLSRVLDDIPPLDVDDATAGRIVDSFRHTACVADNFLQSMCPCRTLTDALAKLDKVETYVIETTDRIASSMARLTSSSTVMSGRLEEQELLSSRLASNMKEHSAHTSNLMEFEKAQRQQMDDHWKRLKEIENVVKRTDATVHTTDEAITETAQQNKRLTAQLTGVRANAENTANIARSDIMDLRACLIPELRDASAFLLTEVKTLQGKLSTLSLATASSIPPPAPPTNPTLEAADATTQVTPPPPHALGISFPPPDTSPQFNSLTGY